MVNPKKEVHDSSLKAIDILEALKDAGRIGLGITEVAKQAGLNKTTVFRIIQALTERDYVIKNEETKKYRLGYKILQFNSVLLDNLEVKEIAHPYIVELAKQVGETIHLVQQDGNFAVYIDKIESPHPVGLLSYIGKRFPLHCSAAGKIFLAYMSDEERNLIISNVGLPSFTPNTITDNKILQAELEVVRRNGYSWNNSEYREEINNMAAPIFNAMGKVIGSVVVAVPAYRFNGEVARRAIIALLDTAQKISQKLGYLSKES